MVVDSSSSMFNIVACTLTVADGAMTADMTMGGTGYRYIYLGTPEEAVAAAETDYLLPEVDAEGLHHYIVPVEALDAGADFAGGRSRAFRAVLRAGEGAEMTAVMVYSSAADAEEVAADVFAALWKHAENIKPSSLKSWLGTVARNTAKNKLRAAGIDGLVKELPPVTRLTKSTLRSSLKSMSGASPKRWPNTKRSASSLKLNSVSP